jgi:methionine-rich copper-binding protein CopC
MRWISPGEARNNTEGLVMKRITLLLGSILLLASGLLRAHTHLETAIPADGAMLKTAPATLELSFGENVQLLKLDVANAAGAAQDIGFTAGASAAKTFSVAVPALAPSAYTVNWTVLGADGHRVEGHYSFTIDPAAAESAGGAEHHAH